MKSTALYERLSRDDELKGESYSIQNQKKLLLTYAKEHGLPDPIHFTDDGISGLRFDRPGFVAMLEKVNRKEIGTILIKDMSRLGRDYLKVGQYMELFRQQGVRLIAVNDSVDTIMGDDEFAPFRNIMNEWYARDTSKKIRSSFKTKGVSGKHVASIAPYGYLNDDNDHNHWIIDEEAAAVVREIYKLTLEGYGPYQITRILREKKIDMPGVHLAKLGRGLHKNVKMKDPYNWSSSTIVGILTKREYLGYTVNFKTQKHFKDKKSHYVSEDNWVLFPGTQEPIIDQETFDTVQKIRGKVRRYPDGWGENHPLTGLMYCADCGAKMYVHRMQNGKRIAQYTCSAYSKVPVGTLCKTQHRVDEEKVLKLIKDILQSLAKQWHNDKKVLENELKLIQKQHVSKEVISAKDKLQAAEKRVEELETLCCRIYEDNILGKLSDDRFETLNHQYESEKNTLNEQIKHYKELLDGQEESANTPLRFFRLLEKYSNFDELTGPMLFDLIDKVVVHERDRKGSTTSTQTIDIHFSYIGHYLPPDFAKDMRTEEEIEKQKKIEEEKNRRHREYLRRKASGWQRKYEERVKTEKRARMEQKMEELRKETMEKGIFHIAGETPLGNIAQTQEDAERIVREKSRAG